MKSNVTPGLSGKVLPIHPQPLPDEIFSSWLCRIAAANGMKLHTFEVQLWGRGKQIWTRDIDKSIDEDTLAHVASVCGTPVGVARDTCLRFYEGRLFESLNTNGNSDWILPAGVFHRIRRRPHMQYCPRCLASDPVPYFRKQWRTAISTFCVVHNVMLHDRCPSCKSPVMFYRQEMGERWTTNVHTLSRCSTCSFDLSQAPADPALILDKHAFATLRLQIDYMDQGWTWTDKGMFHYSHLYFRVLRNLLQKIASSWTTRRLLRVAEVRMRFTSSHPPGRTSFEYLDLNTRHALLQAATWLLLDWPHRFVHLFGVNRCRYSELTREFEQIPFWFWQEVQHLEVNPIGPSEEELQAMKCAYENATDHKRRMRLRRAIAGRTAGASLLKLLGPIAEGSEVCQTLSCSSSDLT